MPRNSAPAAACSPRGAGPEPAGREDALREGRPPTPAGRQDVLHHPLIRRRRQDVLRED